MAKYLHLLLVTVTLFVCCTTPQKEAVTDVIPLKVDWNNISEEMDYSPLVEDSVLIFPLETTDDYLIGEVTDLIYRNNLIYIADNLSKSVFVFDTSGKLQTRIHAVGNGPGEYVDISYFTVYGTDMVILDHFLQKLFFYDKSGQFVRDKDISDIWGVDMFCMGNKLYLPNDDSKSKKGYYHLFTIDLANVDKYGMYQPFERPKGEYGWSIDTYHAALEDEALIWHWPNDTLYTVRGEEIFPSYVFDFGNRLLPEQYRNGDSRQALKTALRDNYVTGINWVKQSDRYLFFQCGDSKNDYMSVYDKKTGELITAKHLYHKKLGDLPLQPQRNHFVIQENKIVQHYDADYWEAVGVEALMSEKKQYYQEAVKQQFIRWAKEGDGESNPVILIQTLKR